MNTGQKCDSSMNKRKLAELIQLNINQSKLRNQLLDIVTYGTDCEKKLSNMDFYVDTKAFSG
jgi:hypothetical protein